ncbi:Hsp20/alpha crystallin family protein [Patescibacteria group bacterium AH-259-L07]|nr:Hsp20/alpha crystallin family protein [Patescibacteria group bacterium AH-259-L07]
MSNEKKDLLAWLEDLLKSGKVPSDQAEKTKKDLAQLKKEGVDLSKYIDIDAGGDFTNLAPPDIGSIGGGVGTIIESIFDLVTKLQGSGVQEIEIGGKKAVFSNVANVRRFGESTEGTGFSKESFTAKPVVTTKKESEPALKEPITDVFDEKNEVVVTAELPGISKKDISVNLEDKNLTIETTGERKYETSISLPATVSQEFTTSFKNGILRIKIQKK